MANIKRIDYKFITLSAYDAFIDLCQRLNITVKGNKPDNNFGKQMMKWRWFRYVEINDEQESLLSEFNYRKI